MKLIAIDAMGGDQAPSSVIEGAIQAVKEGVDCVLVGDKIIIEQIVDNRISFE